ncbi:MAG: response regulator transcription factor [Actinomycetes bacterium]
MRVLVVEDDERVADLVGRALRGAGFAVDTANDGVDALWFANEFPFDVIVLDVNIPAPNGLEVCRRLRAEGNRTPILLLTGRDAIDDRVEGLDAGADDYVPKPFAMKEVLARVRALSRRGEIARAPVTQVGDTALDPATHTVRRGGREIELTAKEFAVLRLLMERAGQVVTTEQVLEHAWDFAYDARSNVVAVYIRYLRNKLDRPFDRASIETVRGVGYRYRSDG